VTAAASDEQQDHPNYESSHPLNRTQVAGILILAAIVLIALLLRYWKFAG
jgi:hypothetical protein